MIFRFWRLNEKWRWVRLELRSSTIPGTRHWPLHVISKPHSVKIMRCYRNFFEGKGLRCQEMQHGGTAEPGCKPTTWRAAVLSCSDWLLVLKTLTRGLSEHQGNWWSTATGCPHCFESSGLPMSPLIRPAAINVPMPIPGRMDTLIEVWHMSGHSSSIYIKADAIEDETRQIRERVRKELRREIKDLQDARSLLVKQLEKLLELKNAHRSTTICWYSG